METLLQRPRPGGGKRRVDRWGYPSPVTPWLILAILAVGVQLTTAIYPEGGFADIEGSFCRYRRPTQCCTGRYDECSMPILGTLCYCDHFCDRNENPDCCPDFWEVCKGLTPKPPVNFTSCSKDGLYIPHGKSYKFNCNECRCINGQLSCDQDTCMIDARVISEVNLAPRQFGWTAANYSEYWGRKARDGLVLKTGTLNPEALSLRMYPILLQPDVSRIPREFDARTKREWQGRVSDVSDQGWCGASWAFSTLGVAQDRLSIESYGNETVRLSPQHLLSCDRRGQKGCEGGHVDRAWQYLRKIGVVNEECYTYESGSTGKVAACRIPRRANLFSLRCAAKQVVFQREDLYKTEPAYRISGKEEDIQWEIMTNGPVQAMVRIHRDLFMYKGGVYANSGLTSETASHSVRIVGWGEDRTLGYNPVKYWLVANSWGRQWGEQGFFRIKRGTNESEIENFIIAVRARLGSYSVVTAPRRTRPFSRRTGGGGGAGGGRTRHSRRTSDYYSHYLHGFKKA
ncbi:uncharacterized peptidase C1-like protein F26E4.3 [Macrobrachium rosenbergii]|uniref:uncharacterized peptidase C1-like protein F26E4.3 n=1 Tax=Macrobrachium rosenbergii TaxID=79674 RepID=UPI0034D5A84C